MNAKSANNSKARRSRSRIVARLVVFLLIGAAVNVLVAWGICNYRPVPYEPLLGEETQRVLKNEWPLPDAEAWPPPTSVIHVWSLGESHIQAYRTLTPDAVVDPEIPFAAQRAGYSHSMYRWSCGLPMHSLESRLISSMMYPTWDEAMRNKRSGWLGEYVVIHGSIGPFGGPFEQIALPLRPRPLGFAVNTIFYALIAFGLWSGLVGAIGSVRRSRRRRRGRCIACGYELGGVSTCPECGSENAEDAKVGRRGRGSGIGGSEGNSAEDL